MVETSVDVEPRGGSVRFAVRVENHGDEDAVLSFSDSQRVSVVLYPIGEAEPCWRSDEEQMFAQMLGSETIPSREAIVFEAVWDEPRSGEYRAVAEVVCREEALRAETTFSV